MELKMKIAQIIAEVLRIAPDTVQQLTMDESLHNIGMDSMNCVEIILLLEAEYGIEFGDEELMIDNLNTLSKLCLIVGQKRGQTTVA